MKRLDKLGPASSDLPTETPHRSPVPTLTRDRTTVVLYAALGMLGYLLNGLGSVLGPLQRQLGVDRTAVAFYPSLFAMALIAVGLVGGNLVGRLGHRLVLRAAVVGMATGALLLGSGTRQITLIGAILLGGSGAFLVQALPIVLTDRHRAAAPAALGEANAVSSFASLLAPCAVALTAAAGTDWRLGYVAPAVPAAIALAILLRTVPATVTGANAGADDLAELPAPGLEPGALLPRWVDVLLAVSVEFCLVFWAADAFADWHGAGPAAAPAMAALFLVGMALARTAAAKLTTGRHPLRIVLVACATAAAGFFVFWLVPATVGAAAGLLVAGAGVALLYPLTLARVVAAWPHARDRASGTAALASGTAIGVAPLCLAGIADQIGLRLAYLIVPVLLAALAAHAAVHLLRGRQPGGARRRDA